VSISCGGGGFGNPLERSPESVLDDLLEKRITPGAAREVYGVVVVGDEVDEAATVAERRTRALAS
jgi:N-methylhydantoinase B